MFPKSAPSWTAAKPSGEGKVLFHPDSEGIAEFAAEFDAIPLPSPAEVAGRLDCRASNMNYIRSALPMAHMGIQDIYLQMAKRQWQGAQPTARPTGAAPQFFAKGMLPIGARRDMVPNPMMVDNSRPRMPGGIATDWNTIPELQRVNAYAFRGDKRHPRQVKSADGFHPPCTRRDAAYIPVIARRFVTYMKDRYNKVLDQQEVEQYIRGKGPAGKVFVEYELWREILKGEELHIGRMVTTEFLKGYISTSRSVTTASGFAMQSSADGKGEGIRGVYALHSEGGFLLPPRGTHVHASNNEAEIAHPGQLSWSKVKAFRIYQIAHMGDARTYKTPEFQAKRRIFVRKGFKEQDPIGAREIILALASF